MAKKGGGFRQGEAREWRRDREGKRTKLTYRRSGLVVAKQEPASEAHVTLVPRVLDTDVLEHRQGGEDYPYLEGTPDQEPSPTMADVVEGRRGQSTVGHDAAAANWRIGTGEVDQGDVRGGAGTIRVVDRPL